MKTIDITQGTPDWHTWRLSGIGASEAPCVLEESPYMTRRELYLSKKGMFSLDNAGKDYIFARGHDAEARMRGEIFALLGYTFEPLCVAHPEHSWMLASLDGYSSSFGVLETKLVGKDVLSRALDGEIPRHHWIQMQHQMTVAQVDSGKYFCSDLKNNGAIVDVSLDKEFSKALTDKEAQFWEMVVSGNIPGLGPKDALVPTDPELFIKLKSLKWQMDRAQIEYDQTLQAMLLAFRHPIVECAGVKLSKVDRAGSISYSKIPELKELHPDYLEKFRGAASSYTKVTIKGESDEQ